MKQEKPTILIVDDTAENIDILHNILNESYTIKVALNGEKALSIVEKNPHINLILLDIMMPDMDGYEVIQILKSDPKTENIPVIFITALGETEDETKGFALGAADYITKPIKPSIVQARVATHINLQTYSSQLKEQNEQLQKLVRVLENKIARVPVCAKEKPETGAETVLPEAHKGPKIQVSVDDYFLEDDKNDLHDMHEEIDSIIHMMLLQDRVESAILKRLGTLFSQYGSKLLIYPVFYRLGSGMANFASTLLEEELTPTHDNIRFSLECLESLIYTLEHWYTQVFDSHITDVNIYDNSMLSDMETIQLALRNEMENVESDIEFF